MGIKEKLYPWIGWILIAVIIICVLALAWISLK